jgi:hypothetical protein
MLAMSSKIYEIADNLDMTVEQDGSLLYGKTSQEVLLGAVPLPVKLEIVSSLLTESEVAVLCRGTGNLALLVLPLDKQGDCAVYVVDVAKMKNKPDSYIERGKFKTGAEIVSDLSPAIARWFIKSGATWTDGNTQGV